MRDTIEVGGRLRSYEVVGEAGGRPGRSLVLIFHGSKQTGAQHRKFTGWAYDALAHSGAAVVVYPDGYRRNWNDARRASSFPARREGIDDVGFTRALIEKLTAGHHIDPRRVFAVGYSNGGQMVMRLAHEAPDLIAGGAVIAATMPTPENFLAAGAPPAPMPMLLVHGTKDPLVPYAGGETSWWVRALFKVGGRSLSAPETAAYFAARNGITEPPVVTPDRIDYRQPGHAPVTLHTVRGGGHTVPGPAAAPFVLGRTSHDLNMAELIDEFFGITSAPSRKP